ncbi:MAG: acetate kinase, partial [Burkholderiaceae bacterium]|nr:acetate kinase [Burkholderiaceae bacterium]
MDPAIAVLNAGSSSIKFSLFVLRAGALEPTHRGQIEGLFTAPHFVARDRGGQIVGEKSWGSGAPLGHGGALAHLLGYVRELLAGRHLAGIGHRVVHGGANHLQPVRVDAAVLEDLERHVPLAPLHQPHNLAPIRELLETAPDLPQVACFDTSFHRGMPQLAQMFALPFEMYEQGVRRYGFHGLSYEYVASVMGDVDSRAAHGRCVVLHLGNGSSMCALLAGHSVATTMGFTAADGLPMGTRCGALDPGVLLYLMERRGMDARQLQELLYQQSGMLGVSGVSSDMRALLASDEPRARLAVDLYCYRIGR